MKTLQNRYILKDQLGSGGMASVWLAFDPILQREVAIKIIQRGFSEQAEFLERFRREAAIAANLDHPGIAKVYEQGDDNGTPFIVMEYVKGVTLKEALLGDITPREAVQIIKEVLGALKYAHQQGVFHRDIKPQNIILSEEGAKLIDFGVAQITGASQLTLPGEIIGTAQYLAPEIAAGKNYTKASDVYSVSAVFYEMLTKQNPYPGKTIIEVIAKQSSSDPILPSKINKDIDPYLDHIVFRGLAKDPKDRFQDAEEFLLAFQTTPEKSSRKIWLLPALLSLFMVVLSFFLLYDSKTEMTSFIGMKKEEALIESKRLGIEPLFLKGESDEPRGIIFWQSQKPGKPIASGEQVLFYLSLGKERAPLVMPNFYGKEVSAGRSFLQKKQIPFKIIFEEGDKGRILQTKPAPGEEIKGAVTLLVGRSTLPDLVGLDSIEAIALLDDLGISYSLDYEESLELEGTVLAQNPLSGSLSQKVALTIASKSSYNTVPDLLGLTESDAISILNENSFSSLILYRRDPLYPPGTVIKQNPFAGEERRIGTTVRVWIASE